MSCETNYLRLLTELPFPFLPQVQDVIDDYKSSVQQIVVLCERICDSPLVNIPQTKAYELKDLDNLMYEYR